MKILKRDAFTPVEAIRLVRLLTGLLCPLSAIAFYNGDWHSGVIYAVGVIAVVGWRFAARKATSEGN